MKMKNINLKLAVAILFVSLSYVSCTNDLDQRDPATASNPTVEELYSNPAAYKETLAKLYAGLATSGSARRASTRSRRKTKNAATSFSRAPITIAS